MIANFISASGNLAYETFGDPSAPPIIFVHGWLSHRGVWRQTTPMLQEKYYCVSLDLLGFGDSDKPADGDYSIPAQAQRVLELADHLGFERFSLVGHSMGGQVCTWLAARTAPERVSRLVSVGGVVSGRLMMRVRTMVPPLVNLAVLYPSMVRLTAQLSDWAPFAHFLFRPWFYRMDSIPFESWELDRRLALRAEIAIPAQQAGLAVPRWNLTADLPRILAPTLGIYGRNDGTIPFADGELLQQLVPNAQLVAFDDCGHFPMYERTDDYLKALDAFLSA